MTDSMRNLLVAAMTKAMKAEPLLPGEYHLRGRVVVEVDCTVRKGEPQTYRPTVHLPLKAILGLALVKAGVNAGDIAFIVAEAAKEALENGREVEVALEPTEEGLKAVEKLLDRLPPQTREGASKIVGNVEVVEFHESRLPALATA
jgi:hypothetical protein